MTTRGRVLLGAALAAAGVTVMAPRWLRRVEFFQVRQVDVTGLRYLEGREVVAAMALPAGASLFDDPAPFEARALAMPGVQRVAVRKRWPGTLVVAVTEWQPVALTPAEGGLAMLDRLGRVLPFDPSRVPADLPVAEADPEVARALFRIRENAPALFRRIGGARRAGQDVALQADGFRVLVRGDVSADDLLNLLAAMADMAERGVNYEELDARFATRVFVRGWKGVKA